MSIGQAGGFGFATELFMVRPTYEKLLDILLILVHRHTVSRPTHGASIGIRLVYECTYYCPTVYHRGDH